MKYPLLGKVVALGAVIVALLFALGAITGVVEERQGRQHEAEQSVVDGLAGSQTVLGPLLQRRCQEVWDAVEGEGRDRRTVEARRDFELTAWPRSLAVHASAGIEPRYRGLFKLNSFLTKANLVADWTDLAALKPTAEHPGGRVRCEAPTLAVALSDARGIRAAAIRAGGENLAIAPGSLLKKHGAGFHAVLPEPQAGAPLHVEITLELAGTRSLGWVPVGEQNRVQLASDWPHPSFGGRFLPTQREVGATGFQATWQVSALASTAQQAVLGEAGLCGPLNGAGDNPKAGCIDSFGVGFIDPVNAYVLADRALKYGLLFIVLTFVGVALVEVMRRVRVHPAQYLLVGCALTVFFLLLLSLSEHLSFGAAYLIASVACTGLLTFYGLYILKGLRPGLVFGAALAVLYGALYALLQLEQTALVLGSLLLFGVLAAVMVATRRVDWYAMSARLREDSAKSVVAAGA